MKLGTAVLYRKLTVMSLAKFNAVTAILCLREYMNFYPQLPYFLTNFRRRLVWKNSTYYWMVANFVKIGAVKNTLYLGRKWSYAIVSYTFRPIWTKFGMRGIHQNLLDNYEFRKNRSSEGHTLPKGVINDLLPYFLHLSQDLFTNQYKKFAGFSICGFRENRR